MANPTALSRKRKRDTDEEGGNMTDKLTVDEGEHDDNDDEDPDEEDEAGDYSAPKLKPTKSKRQLASAESKAKDKAPSPKKNRTVKAKGPTGTRKGKADASIDIVMQIKDSQISDDNMLFSAFCYPSFSLTRRPFHLRRCDSQPIGCPTIFR